MKRVLNLSADKVNGYVFKDSPSIYWSWWHVLLTVAFVVLVVFALCAPFSKAHAASFPAGEHLQCRIELESVGGGRKLTFKSYDDSHIKLANSNTLVLRGDAQVPESTVNLNNGELFATRGSWTYRGLCKNVDNIRINP
ncbi:hypothetical protein [Escherichia phage PJNS034]